MWFKSIRKAHNTNRDDDERYTYYAIPRIMRLSIREQLGFLVLFCSLSSLMVLALAVWFQSYNFITDQRLDVLALTASLKAAQLSSTLLLFQSQVQAISTRILIQSALQRYNTGNTSSWDPVSVGSDLEGALGDGNLLMQVILYPNNGANATSTSGLLNVTAADVLDEVPLPYNYSNGSSVYLGDPGLGYPPPLYPNLTYSAGNSSIIVVDGRSLGPGDMLVYGPIYINESYALISATTAMVNNTSSGEVLGWLTVVLDASDIFAVATSPEGLGSTGQVLVVGSSDMDNRYPIRVRNSTAQAIQNQQVRFILPPLDNSTVGNRHSLRAAIQNVSAPFPMSAYPAVVDAWAHNNHAINNAGAMIHTHNEQNIAVSVGYATVATRLVDWILIVEQSQSEVVAPIKHLRDVVLACVFSVTGFLLVVVFPLAHYSVSPIRELRAATAKTVEPYQPDDGSEYALSSRDETAFTEDESPMDSEVARKEGFFAGILGLGSSKEKVSRTRGTRRRTFRIPSKVPERKHWVTDELTELTRTFNEMSDELSMHYQRLEERVKERTAELEQAKAAAEAANQSKTLFIANISHELKTPLNGILGLTTVCMQEDDIHRIRSTLNTIYKSGDLLLHLLTDLLTFSKNEVGQQLSIDETEFRISDLSTQLMPTFEKQARESQIKLEVFYLGTSDAFGNTGAEAGEKLYGPLGTGRVRDMCLWGDKNRILQVLMNFVSNSLKFTPAHGSVTVRIRCTGIMEHVESKPGSARKSSFNSRKSKSSSRKKGRNSDTSLQSVKWRETESSDDDNKQHSNNHSGAGNKLSINVAGETAQIAKYAQRQRSMSPPPLNTKDLAFEFEVEDTGPGIPSDQQRKIFEPFVQGDLGLSKKYGGTGLGLSICAQLAGLMGGDVALESTVGKGSKFAMRIPLRYVCERTPSTSSSTYRPGSKTSSIVGEPLHDRDASLHAHASTQSLSSVTNNDQAHQPKLADVPRIVGFTAPYLAKDTAAETKPKIQDMKRAESEAAKKGRKVRVLVAEDNQVNQEVVLRMLKLEDVYDVTIAKDGQEAFDKVRESMNNGDRFDLVFMDVQMPNLDGIQSTKLIREMGFKSPIVALTAFAEKSNEDECMASGMDYFLSKPIRRPALKQVLKKYCATIPEEDTEGSTASAKPSSKPPPTGIGQGAFGKATHLRVDDSTNVSPMS